MSFATRLALPRLARAMSYSSNFGNNMTNNTKLALSASGYLAASLGVAKIAESKNMGYIFKQLGDW
ncbi:hypothetical protein CAAN1_01S00848 [[Candida] anglica]|uniref:Uncharacterized protein n=1 Tax=[Candida] anglica TaxID=148631 RepID=A0ABP0EJF6_9ASCO